jgi:hypothetical protein
MYEISRHGHNANTQTRTRREIGSAFPYSWRIGCSTSLKVKQLMCNKTMDIPADAKIIDLLKKREEGSKPFVSIEFFPPRSEDGVTVSLVMDANLSPGIARHPFLMLLLLNGFTRIFMPVWSV